MGALKGTPVATGMCSVFNAADRRVYSVKYGPTGRSILSVTIFRSLQCLQTVQPAPTQNYKAFEGGLHSTDVVAFVLLTQQPWFFTSTLPKFI